MAQINTDFNKCRAGREAMTKHSEVNLIQHLRKEFLTGFTGYVKKNRPDYYPYLALTKMK